VSNQQSGRTKVLTFALVGLILLCAMADVAAAQKRTVGTFPARRRTVPTREAEVGNRELGFRLMNEQPKTKKPNEYERKLILSQIFEDFEHIQLISNEMMRAASTSQSLDYKHLSHAAEEMSRRAKRLKINLGIPHSEEAGRSQKHQVASNGEQVKALLVSLNQSVKSLVTNPFFQNPKVAESHQFARVTSDLSGIFELSHSIKRSAEKLKK
jgi:hypothetical protein